MLLGLDNIWCKEADEYKKKVLKKFDYQESNCAIYISNQSIKHLDWKTIISSINQNDKNSNLNWKYKNALFNDFIKNKYSNSYTDPQKDGLVSKIIQ